MRETSVFVIGHDPTTRNSLVELLRSDGIRSRAFPCAKAFLDAPPEKQSACIIAELCLPRAVGAERIRRLSLLYGGLWPVVVVTAHANVDIAVHMMKQGVSDLIEKPSDPEHLLSAVHRCIAAAERRLMQHQTDEELSSRLANLTTRERQILDALVEGRTNKQIGRSLGLSPRTVEIFRAKVMRKTRVTSLPALVRLALRVPRKPGL